MHNEIWKKIKHTLGLSPGFFTVIFSIIFIIGVLFGLLYKHYNDRLAPEITPLDMKVKNVEIVREGSSKKDGGSLPQVYLDDPKFSKEDVFKALNAQYIAWINNAIDVEYEDISGPIISLIIDDMGVDFIRTDEILKLKAPLTLSYLSYAKNLSGQLKKASRMGYELMLHVAMQAMQNSSDYGPEPLMLSMSSSEIKSRLASILNRSNQIVGINNHMGSKFTSDRTAMQTVIEEVKKRGLLFVDSKTIGSSKAANVARDLETPYAERDTFIDDNPRDINVIKSQLALTERIAKKKGYAVAIAHPRDKTIEALKEWLPTLEEKGIKLVPISALIKKKIIEDN